MSSANNSSGFADSLALNGGDSPESGHDANISIINKVKSRVSSILPSSISNWLSPSARNGNLRRRRDDSESEELAGDDDADDVANRNGGSSVFGIPPLKTSQRPQGLPPTKRSRLDVAPEADFSFAPRSSQSIPFAYSTPAATSNLVNRRNLISDDANVSTPFTFTAGAINNNVAKPTPVVGDETTDEEADTDDRPVQPHPGHSYASNQRKLNIGLSSAAGTTTNKWLEAGGFKANEDEDDDRASHLDDANGLANESASEGSDGSAAARKLNIYTSLQRDYDGQQKRRVGGLFGSDGGSSSKMSRTASSRHPAEVGLNFSTHLQGHKSLFPNADANRSNSLNASTTSLNSLHRRQSSLYGSTSALSDSRLLGGTHSPFYNGRTMFGGASAYSRRANSTQRTLRVPTQIRPASSLSGTSGRSLAASVGSDQPTIGSRTSTISNTAQRILELMNQFTTPLNDVKKMANATHVPALVAHRKRFDESDMVASRSVRLNTPSTPYTRNSASRRTNTPSMMATELQVPTMSSLMQMKKVLQNKTEKVRELASGSNSILNKDAVYTLPAQNDQPADKSADTKRKIRNKITSTRANTKHAQDQHEVADPVNLPDIRLQLGQTTAPLDIGKTLAVPPTTKTTAASSTFSFANNPKTTSTQSFPTAAAPSSLATTKSTATTLAASSTPTPPAATHQPFTSSAFNFSMPIALTTPASAQHVTAIANFTFSEPIQVNSCTTTMPSSPKPAAPVTSFDNHIMRVSAAAPKLKTGSVMDILGKSPASTAAVPPATSTAPTTSSSSAFASTSTQPAAAAAALPSLSAMFAPKSNQWECDSCMLKNNADKTRCVACESPKPGAASATAAAVKPFQSTPATLPSITQSFGSQFKAAAKTWECDACMIRNKEDATKCVACETAKPGAKQSPAATSFGSSFTPAAAKPDAGFAGLLAKQNSKWECSACMTRNDAQRKKCECCDQEKPGTSGGAADASPSPFGKATSVSLATSAKFSFGVKFDANAPAPTPITAASSMPPLSADKPSFTFGVQPPSATTTAAATKPTFSFGAGATVAKPDASKTTTSETSAKKDDVDAAPAATFSFGAPKPVPTEATKPAVEAFKPTPPETTSSSIKTTAPVSFGGFAFGTAAKPAANETPAAGGGFSFGTSTAKSDAAAPASKPLGGFSFGSQASADKPAVVAPTATETTTTTTKSFVFGSSSAVPANPAPFVAAKTDAVKPLMDATKREEEQRNGGFSFGSGTTLPSKVAELKSSVPMFGQTPAAPASTAAPPSFLTTNSARATSSIAPEKAFVFGSAAKPITSSSSLGTATAGNLFTSDKGLSAFGSSASSTIGQPPSFGAPATAVPAPAPSSAFTFGSSSSSAATPAPSTAAVAPMFGSGAAPAPFGQTPSTETSAPSRPAFGSFDAPAPSAFGSTAFGASSAVAGQPTTPSFGNVHAFGSASSAQPAPTFGASTGLPSFGGMSSAFGASAAAPSGFATPSSNNSCSDEPQRKKSFGSGMSSLSTQPPAFSFGAPAAPSTPAKTPFNFSATAPPSFNFTGNQTQPQAQPQHQMSSAQPFSFGAPSTIAPSAGVFSFGSGPSETTPSTPFQFAAESASPNLFLPQTPTANAANGIQQRRKVRAVRRNIR